MKKIILVLLFLVIFSMLGLFAYFYYIKPQREYIKRVVQNCVNKATTPIDSEVAKTPSSYYINKNGFDGMSQKQSIEVDKCISNYDTILFSESERKLFGLDVSSRLDAQKEKITNYKNMVDNILAEANKKEDQKKACLDMQDQYKTVHDNYEKCIQEAMKSSRVSPNYFLMDDSNPCLKKYNFSKYLDFNNSFGCMMNFGIDVMK